MRRPVAKIRVAERNVRSARLHLLQDVAITTSIGTMRNLPSYTGTTGQWRHKCLQPRLASMKPTIFCRIRQYQMGS